MLSFDIAGKHAVITGGGGAIASATAMAMAELGSSVTLLDRDESAARAIAARIRDAGGVADAARLDVSDHDSVRQVFDAIDTPDILVTTAGIIAYRPFLEQDEQSLRQMLDVNLQGTFLCVQAAARRMTDGGGGSIVTLASTAAFVASRLPAVAYAMTKAGVRHLTTAASVELAPLGVRINAVAPATIDTPFVRGTLETEEQRRETAARSPIGRVGQPADVVGAIVFLASPLASFITGHTLVIDGGRLSRSG